MAGQIQCWINTFLLNSMGLLLWVAQANDGGMRIELQPQAFSPLPRVGLPAHAVIRLLDDGPRSEKHYETLFSIDMERVMLKNGELDELLIWHRRQMLAIRHRLSLDVAQGVVATLTSENERISGGAADAAQLALAFQESNDAEKAQLNAEIARLKAELARVNADPHVAPAGAEVGALQAQLEELRVENARLTSQLDESRADYQALLDAGDPIDLTLGGDEEDTGSSVSLAALRSELDRANVDLHSLRKQNSDLLAQNAQILDSFNDCECGNRITDSFNDVKCASCRNSEGGSDFDVAGESPEAEVVSGKKECAKCAGEFKPRQAAYRFCRDCHQQHLAQSKARGKKQARARSQASNVPNRPPRASKAVADVAAPLPSDDGSLVRQRNRRRRRPRASKVAAATKVAADAAAPLPSDGGGLARQRNRRHRRPRANKAAAEAAAPLPSDDGGSVHQRNHRRRRPRGRVVADKASLGTAPANVGGIGSRHTVAMVPNDDVPPAVAGATSPPGTGHAPPPAPPPAADLMLALEQIKKEMKTMIEQQLQEVQNQWQTNFDQLRQEAPEVLSAPVQSALPQMPVSSFPPYHSYQGFGNNFYHPNPWLMSHMAANPLSQLSPSYPLYATAGQGGSKA
jgi:hypothetical protein